METNRLRQFLVVSETGNLRRAAELLSLSHSALSKSIKVLEAELGLKLLSPSGRGIEITPDGRDLAGRVPELLKQVESLRVAGREPKALVRFATFEVFSTYFMGHLAQELKRGVGEGYRLQILEAIPGHIEDHLLHGRADVGLTYLPIPRQGLRFQKVGKVEMGIFSRRKSFSGMATEELPFAVPLAPVEGTPSDVKGLDGWPDHLFPRQVRFEMDLMETAIQLCYQGLCVVFLPRFIAKIHNSYVEKAFHLEEHPLPRRFPSVQRAIFLVSRKDREEGKLERITAKVVRQVCH